MSFGADVAFAPRDDRLDDVTVAPLTAPRATGSLVQATIFRVAPSGRIARHPATVAQILAVLEGAGRVSGAEGEFQPISAGEAVFWTADEEHETQTDDGLTALVLEAENLQVFRPRPESRRSTRPNRTSAGPKERLVRSASPQGPESQTCAPPLAQSHSLTTVAGGFGRRIKFMHRTGCGLTPFPHGRGRPSFSVVGPGWKPRVLGRLRWNTVGNRGGATEANVRLAEARKTA